MENEEQKTDKLFTFVGFKDRKFTYQAEAEGEEKEGAKLSGVVDYRTEMLPTMKESELVGSFESN